MGKTKTFKGKKKQLLIKKDKVKKLSEADLAEVGGGDRSCLNSISSPTTLQCF